MAPAWNKKKSKPKGEEREPQNAEESFPTTTTEPLLGRWSLRSRAHLTSSSLLGSAAIGR